MPDDGWLRAALPLEDLSLLEPPEPLHRILITCTSLARDVVYCARLRHVPTPLFPHLEARDLEWRAGDCADGTAIVWIRRRSE